MMVMEMWGIMLFCMKLNVFSAAAIIMTTTLSPVFTVYMAVEFRINQHLPPKERLSAAMGVVFPTILQGSLGIFHGFVVSPVLLALVSQNETVPCEVKESECVGSAIEIAILQGGPNLLELSPPDKLAK